MNISLIYENESSIGRIRSLPNKTNWGGSPITLLELRRTEETLATDSHSTCDCALVLQRESSSLIKLSLMSTGARIQGTHKRLVKCILSRS